MSITRRSPTKAINISVVAWCSLLILNESPSWHPERDMRMLHSNAWYSDWQAEHNIGASIIMMFSACEQCYQMPLFQSPTLMTETKLRWSVTRLKQFVRPLHAWCHFVRPTLLLLGPHVRYIPRMSWLSPTQNIVTKWVTKRWVPNKKVTKHVIGPPTVWVSSLINSVVYVSCELSFVSVMSVGDWNSGIW